MAIETIPPSETNFASNANRLMLAQPLLFDRLRDGGPVEAAR